MKQLRCPVCKKPLSKKEYEQALGILGEREKHLHHEKAELQQKLKNAQVKQKLAKEDGIKQERSRTQRLLAGKDKQIQSLKERVDQLKKGSTPQTEGLEFEDILEARLRKEFPTDKIEHPGKGGDILQIVFYEKKEAGLIVYECKRTPRIQTDHVRQAFAAKQSRKGDFAVLVTTGQKKGFSGLAHIDGVLVVAPLGSIPLASLLRAHLIEMMKAKISKEQRVIIAQELMKFIASPKFKNPIEEVIQLSSELQEMIKSEAKEHFRVWKKRWNYYQTINWDSYQIQSNVQLVLHGKEPKDIVHKKPSRLELPAAGD